MDTPPAEKPHKCLDLLVAAFVASLLVTGTVASKIFAPLGGLIFNGGALFIPINYILGGILTEVYGYARARRVIWAGFAAAAFMSLSYWLVGRIPPSPTWPLQAAYDSILGVVPRIVAASLTAYFLGEFTNSFVLAKMKILTRGRYLWTRTVGAALAGQAMDTVVFIVFAFYGTQSLKVLAIISLSIYFLKIAIEIAALPVVYNLVNFLKRKEGEDYFDTDTNFNPFAFHRGNR
ncbi:MAG TPA: queuosine precursor transporter [Terriglobia bacterium]|nr:queuosine precursor transporter [Terriglobia bacterium]